MLLSVAIVVSVAVNFLNGLMVTKFMTPAFIATLATQTMARGAALYITNGQNIYEIGNYTIVGQGSIGVIPIPVIFMVLHFYSDGIYDASYMLGTFHLCSRW